MGHMKTKQEAGQPFEWPLRGSWAAELPGHFCWWKPIL